MPSPEVASLKQIAVLWPFAGYDQAGQAKVGSPMEVPVRWETRRSETLDAHGNTITLDAVVFTNQRIHVDSNMWLGRLTGLVGTAPIPELMIVKTNREIPDIKGRVTLYGVGLMRFRGTLP
jgi:hypothetical protein